MPIVIKKCGESPFHSVRRQAGSYVNIARDVLIVVIIEEAIVSDGTVGEQCGSGQQHTQEKSTAPRRLELAGGR
jgi:hypothetical protein